MLALGVSPFLMRLAGVPDGFLRFMGNPYITLIASAVLLGYLSWPWLQVKLGRLYLPLALGIATLAPMLASYFGIDFSEPGELLQVRSLAGQWQVIFLLFIPLIFISWQYDFRAVLFYCLALVAVDLTFILIPILAADFFLRPWIQAGPVLLRSAVYLLAGYIVTRLVAGQREQTARLEQAYRQLADFAAEKEQLARSQERNRLARELHDTLAHTLSANVVQLEAVDSLWDKDRPQAHEILEQSLQLTRDGLQDTRRAIQSLRTSPADGPLPVPRT